MQSFGEANHHISKYKQYFQLARPEWSLVSDFEKH